MKPASLPDPLSVWIQASCASTEPVDAESLAASLNALWRNQEEMLKSLGAMVGQAQIAELAAEVMLRPLRRQAQLLEISPIPNPKQAAILATALQTWLALQLGLAQAAAMDVAKQGQVPSVLHAWVEAFAQRQHRFLASDHGQQSFASLCRAWAGLHARREAPAEPLSATHLHSCGKPSGPPLLVLASPFCPLASFADIKGGLMAELAERFDVSVVAWGDLSSVRSPADLQRLLAPSIAAFSAREKAQVLDLTAGSLGLAADATVITVDVDGCSTRLQRLAAAFTPAQLGLQQDNVLPAELLAVLCDAVYPDWAVSAWLAGPELTALQTRRRWLESLPDVTAELLSSCFLAEQPRPEPQARVLPCDEAQTLLQLLSGRGAASISDEIGAFGR